MKNTCLFILLCVLSFKMFSQDYITFKNGSRIEVVILDVKPDIVQFKYFNDPSGNVYFNYKREIASILFQNGKVEFFDENTPSANKTENNSEPVYKTPFINELNTSDFNLGNKPDNNNAYPQEHSTVQPPVNPPVNPNTPYTNQYPADNYTYNRQPQSTPTYEKKSYNDAREWNSRNFQEKSQIKRLTFGLKGGVGTSSLSDISKQDIGFKGGVDLDINLTKNMAIRTMLLYSLRRQGKSYDMANIATFDAEARLNYLELPVSFVYKFPIGNKSNLYLNAGPYVAYGLSGKLLLKNDVLGNFEIDAFADDVFSLFNQEISTNAPMKRFDMGFTFGAGVEISRFNLGLNYDLGIIDMNESGDKNSNYWLSLGFKF